MVARLIAVALCVFSHSQMLSARLAMAEPVRDTPCPVTRTLNPGKPTR